MRGGRADGLSSHVAAPGLELQTLTPIPAVPEALEDGPGICSFVPSSLC